MDKHSNLVKHNAKPLALTLYYLADRKTSVWPKFLFQNEKGSSKTILMAHVH